MAKGKPIVEISDRYSATGTPRPDPVTVCKGHCEGMGYYPTKDLDDIERAEKDGRLIHSQKEDPSELNYAWVRCEPCSGTGKRPAH